MWMKMGTATGCLSQKRYILNGLTLTFSFLLSLVVVLTSQRALSTSHENFFYPKTVTKTCLFMINFLPPGVPTYFSEQPGN